MKWSGTIGGKNKYLCHIFSDHYKTGKGGKKGGSASAREGVSSNGKGQGHCDSRAERQLGGPPELWRASEAAERTSEGLRGIWKSIRGSWKVLKGPPWPLQYIKGSWKDLRGSWEGLGRTEQKQKQRKRRWQKRITCSDAIGHCPLWGPCPKIKL